METKNNNILGIVLALVIGLAVGYFFAGNMKKVEVSDQSGASNLAPVVKKSNELMDSYNVALNTTFNNPSCQQGQYFVQGACYNSNQILVNESNPYDFAGRGHNQMVKYLLEKSGAQKASKESIYKWAQDYAASTGIIINGELFESIKNREENPGSNPNLSKAANVYEAQIFAVDVSSVANSFKNFVSIENAVQKDASLKANEKKNLLALASVARNSNFLWNTVGLPIGTSDLPMHIFSWDEGYLLDCLNNDNPLPTLEQCYTLAGISSMLGFSIGGSYL